MASLSVPTCGFSAAGTYTSTGTNSVLTHDFSLATSTPFTDGGGANQANKYYRTTVSLAGSATSDLDLAGVLTDVTGATITFATIKFFAVVASSSNNASNSMQVTRPAAAGALWLMAAGDGIALPPGAWFATGNPNAAGYTVTATTADLITFTNSAGTNTITAEVLIIGD